ncbi:hypothetical protein D9756_007818 [Leucocoprinus leucothites]|uniref:Nephrocystin 3-like N-terminal domain-containing protein n=1 Tax=Leucocoprinus leucothites TaxID=201217 RepID=A0A8H5D6B6_9AGAR|nr:hypothetical protein D9756_007818 [Leucoagaricus leucothites]
MSILSGAHDFVANNCHFIINEGGPDDIEILHNKANHEAAFDSLERAPPPMCHPGTRVQYVEDIVRYAVPGVQVGDRNKSQPLFWMSGPAGVGKTAIAQTCVETIKDKGQPFASFFFSINGRKNPTQFFPTIAYQLSTKFAEYRALLGKKIRQDRSLIHKVMESQLRGLIIEPWLELLAYGQGIPENSGYKIPIFVDGLDECDDPRAQCTIIELVAKSTQNASLPFCWLFFSRPEIHITTTFDRDQIKVLCRKTFLPISRDTDGEIENYLRAGFDDILQRRGLLYLTETAPWPTHDQMRKLIDAADGLFIFAATALRLIDDPMWTGPEEPLRAVLGGSTGNSASPSGTNPSPFAELDNLYHMIMERIPANMLHLVHLLLNVLCFAEAGVGHAGGILGAAVLGNVLNISAMQFRGICSQLSAVLHFEDQRTSLSLPEGTDAAVSYLNAGSHPGKRIDTLRNFVFRQLGGSVSFYHKSFYDFLSDPNRSMNHSFESPTAYNELFQHCIQRHLDFDASYHFDDSEGLALSDDAKSSASCLSYPTTSEFSSSLLQAMTYSFLYRRCMWLCGLPFITLELRQKFSQCDFRKALYAQTTLFHKPRAWSNSLWGTHGRAKLMRGTRLFQTTHATYADSNIEEFMQRIELLQEAGVIQKHENCPSSLQCNQDQCESGLYVIGHGTKSTFWFWEINRSTGFYRDFETVDLTRGMTLFQDEDFTLWPQ